MKQIYYDDGKRFNNIFDWCEIQIFATRDKNLHLQNCELEITNNTVSVLSHNF